MLDRADSDVAPSSPLNCCLCNGSWLLLSDLVLDVRGLTKLSKQSLGSIVKDSTNYAYLLYTRGGH